MFSLSQQRKANKVIIDYLNASLNEQDRVFDVQQKMNFCGVVGVSRLFWLDELRPTTFGLGKMVTPALPMILSMMIGDGVCY